MLYTYSYSLNLIFIILYNILNKIFVNLINLTDLKNINFLNNLVNILEFSIEWYWYRICIFSNDNIIYREAVYLEYIIDILKTQYSVSRVQYLVQVRDIQCDKNY